MGQPLRRPVLRPAPRRLRRRGPHGRATGEGRPDAGLGREKPHGQSLWWPILARNKKSVTLDLRGVRGEGLARSLIATADVLVENFRPGTLERWGLGPDRLQADDPGLVITRVTGYGQSGPYAARAGFGSIGEAMGGIRYVTGDPGRPPSRAGISLGDELAGTFAALGTLVALHARQRTGAGQIVDAALYEAVLAMMESLLPEWEVAGYQRERTGSVLPNVAPSNVYPALDGPVLIAADQDSVFRRLVTVMGQPELVNDPRYATHEARGVSADALDELIGEWTAAQPAAELLALLHENGIPAGLSTAPPTCSPTRTSGPGRRSSGWRTRSSASCRCRTCSPACQVRPARCSRLGPALGQHNAEVYGELLKLTAAELAELTTAGVI